MENRSLAFLGKSLAGLVEIHRICPELAASEAGCSVALYHDAEHMLRTGMAMVWSKTLHLESAG